MVEDGQYMCKSRTTPRDWFKCTRPEHPARGGVMLCTVQCRPASACARGLARPMPTLCRSLFILPVSAHPTTKIIIITDCSKLCPMILWLPQCIFLLPFDLRNIINIIRRLIMSQKYHLFLSLPQSSPTSFFFPPSSLTLSHPPSLPLPCT